MAQPAMSSGSDHTRSEGWTNRVQRSKCNQYKLHNNANKQDWLGNASAGVDALYCNNNDKTWHCATCINRLIPHVRNSSCKESRNDDAHLRLMLPNLSPSPDYTKYRVFTITM